MNNLAQFLKAEYVPYLTFDEHTVLFDKPLMVTLKHLGYRLELHDYATKVILYKGEEVLGEVDYKVKQVWHERGKEDYYDEMYLDLTTFDTHHER